ncbi:MAG: class I SAM-dependent methyltransferase [Candidatus Marinimicrobia bacterium]|nr:class I SAM-dependent methyltransferase [Candidatus Neomarinimicrobiota bacterium]
MATNKTKESLEKSFEFLETFSEKYKIDFKRFLFSLDTLVKECDSLEGKRVLDIGSGVGLMSVALKNLGCDVVVGLEKFIFPSEEENFFSVSEFSKLEEIWRANNIEVVKSDAIKERLPFEDGSFDIVICDAMIEHLDESPKGLFEEVNRVLGQGGVFFVSTPNLANLLKRLRFSVGRSPHWDLKDFYESGDNFVGHRREFTVKEVCSMLKWSSFNILASKTKNIFFEPKRLFSKKKAIAQICSLLSFPFPSMREMIYVLSTKSKISNSK